MAHDIFSWAILLNLPKYNLHDYGLRTAANFGTFF